MVLSGRSPRLVQFSSNRCTGLGFRPFNLYVEHLASALDYSHRDYNKIGEQEESQGCTFWVQKLSVCYGKYGMKLYTNNKS
ncbi:hypothetical protein XELAEV_18017888mg [Xenopus laevis]|uniref:Uncharacterized protein n=1 Tax=Xenopus laevis TaxID=8355 RepID=A0A974HTA7_XENLA|nr:hypothetical protein XELAEV_18017888mg [Xenopus laevis]